MQNFALQKAIEFLGFKAVTIDYHSDNIEKQYKVKLIDHDRKGLGYIKSVIVNLYNHKWDINRKKAFDDFRKKMLCLTDPVDTGNIQKYSDAFNTYICGSDQIWNKNIISDEDEKVYALSFVKAGKKKVSYAASAGSSEFMNETIAQKIEDFNIITVRENELANYLINRMDRDVPVVLDPVFLLDKGIWESYVYSFRRNNVTGAFNNKKYVFSYCISSFIREIKDISKYIAKEKGLEIIYPMKKRKDTLFLGKCVNEHGPFEFVYDIANADCVVVSSFHAVAFSIIYEKEFVTVLHENTSSRVENLLSELGLSERIVRNLDDYIAKRDSWSPIDYKSVKNKLEKLRKDSYEVLKEMCRT